MNSKIKYTSKKDFFNTAEEPGFIMPPCFMSML
jgi:hypothetical protein